LHALAQDSPLAKSADEGVTTRGIPPAHLANWHMQQTMPTQLTKEKLKGTRGQLQFAGQTTLLGDS